ncbi:MAG: TrmB family transcriptional regulator sugar-binding domain-containing protein [Euryarchaeota archaeon]|nr:TrmB family transcriptional regulator sugar-binding domain-containing protein [Euryarchaeota archaeon]
MRIKFLDFLIILLVLISLFSYFSKYREYEQKETLEYSGSQIFKAIKDFENYTSKGFLYEVTIVGRLNMDDSEFEDTGFVTETGKGYFVFKSYEGEMYTVGGVMGYKEDVSVKSIKMTIKNKSTVFYRAKPIEEKSFEAIYAHVKTTSDFMEFKGIYDIAISGTFTVTPAGDYNEELEDILYCKSVSFDDNMLTLKQFSIKELKNLDSIIRPERIYTGDFWVIVRTKKEIKELEKYEIKRKDDDNPGIYEDSIHIRL